MGFGLNDTVSWSSQAHGFRKDKVGRIVAVVPAEGNPVRYVPHGFRAPSSPGLPRGHESYLVAVGTKIYWPRVNDLKTIMGLEGEAVLKAGQSVTQDLLERLTKAWLQSLVAAGMGRAMAKATVEKKLDSILRELTRADSASTPKTKTRKP